MWVITVHSKNTIRMFEFETERAAREALQEINGCKILSEVIYFNDYYHIETNELSLEGSLCPDTPMYKL